MRPSVELYVDKNWNMSRKSDGGSSRRSEAVVVREGERGGGRGETTKRSFARRCSSLVKEQRARFYIMRRCIIMLICWREYPDYEC